MCYEFWLFFKKQKNIKKMKIIVFGGNGFIGRHLSFLLEKKNKVFIYGNKDYSKKGNNLIKYN